MISSKGTTEQYSKRFRLFRNRLADKLQDPSFEQVRLYDLRHYFATPIYHKTRDILFTKQFSIFFYDSDKRNV